MDGAEDLFYRICHICHCIVGVHGFCLHLYGRHFQKALQGTGCLDIKESLDRDELLQELVRHYLAD